MERKCPRITRHLYQGQKYDWEKGVRVFEYYN